MFSVNTPTSDQLIKVINRVKAERYGMYESAHHKQWVIDQMLRRLLGDAYD